MKKQRSVLILLLLSTVTSIQNLPVTANPSGVYRQPKTFSTRNIIRPPANKPTNQSKQPVMLGLYTVGYAGEQSVINKQLLRIDNWAEKILARWHIFR